MNGQSKSWIWNQQMDIKVFIKNDVLNGVEAYKRDDCEDLISIHIIS